MSALRSTDYRGKVKLGNPVILGDHDAFIAFGEKGYKVEKYSD